MPCPDIDTIAELVCRKLDDGKASEVEAHVADCASCRKLVGALAAGSVDAAPPAVDVAHAIAAEPRYVVRRELARGGMGRISIAHDTLLDRTVAIKELLAPSAALVARFQRELALTSRLQHPSIVSIHDGGVWPTGEPFYVMRLISGEPLDRVIARNDAPAARLGLVPSCIAMVDALAYAHSQGVIHRDLKPANVLVGDFGETVVIDWGLAKDLRRPAVELASEPARDPLETTAGLVVGTPAYMAPEQARGETVDERADVYALGAVLYHVLGGVAPHAGATASEIIRAVLAQPPVPLVERAAEIPFDLVAIVDKAMARRPGDRYAAAGELAVDLKRFQRGQLVGAQRYSRWQLAGRWIRRHRAAVAVGTVATIALAFVAIASVRRVVAEQHRAELSRADAEELMTFMLTDLRDKLEPIGKLDLLRTIAGKARDYYAQRPDERSPDARYKQDLAHANLGHVLQDQGDLSGALAEYRAALRLAESLAAEAPASADWQHELSSNHRKIGEALELSGSLPAALAEYRAARAVDEALVAREPSGKIARSDLLQSRIDIGRVVGAQGDTAAELVELRAALELARALELAEPDNPTRKRELYVCHYDIGDALATQGAGVAAIAEYRAAEAIAHARVARTPTDGEALRDLWLTEIAIGKTLVEQGDTDGGLAELRAAAAISTQLVARDPSNVVWQRDYTGSQNEIGNVLLAQGHPAEALVAFRDGQHVIEALAARMPDNTGVQRDVEVSASRVGAALEDRGELATALVEYRKVLAIAETLAARDRSDASLALELANAHNDLGSALQSSRDDAGALAEFRAAAAIARDTVAKDPTNAKAQRLLWALELNIADIVVASDATTAVAECRAAMAIAKQLADAQPTDLEARGDLCVSHQKLGAALEAQRSFDDALVELRSALATAEDLVANDPSTTAWQDDLVAAHTELANVLHAQGNAAAAVREYKAAAALRQKAASAHAN